MTWPTPLFRQLKINKLSYDKNVVICGTVPLYESKTVRAYDGN